MIIHSDARAIPLADCSMNCVVTSPPYWRQRDYGYPAQLGQEETLKEYIDALVSVFAEVHRVLRNDGTLWLNMGDCYASGGRTRTLENSTAKSTIAGKPTGQQQMLNVATRMGNGVARKNLMGLPWRVAFALQDVGWNLRSDVIWFKTNPMPSNVKDRPTCAHEYIFLFSRRPSYYYDHQSMQEPATSTEARYWSDNGRDKQRGHSRQHAGFNRSYAEKIAREGVPKTRNVRDVWPMAVARFEDSHYATFPPELARRCILAGCPEGGIVFDPFAGSGTSIMAAQDLGRRGVGLELGAKYLPMAHRRTAQRALC